jgi:hypothetical protein
VFQSPACSVSPGSFHRMDRPCAGSRITLVRTRCRGHSGHGWRVRALRVLTHCRQQASAGRRPAARGQGDRRSHRWAKSDGEGDSGTDRGAAQRERAQAVGLAGPMNAPMKKTARRLLLRSAFKQSVVDLLRYEALRPLPCLVIVTAEREELLEHDALGCCIDGSSPHVLHQRA